MKTVQTKSKAEPDHIDKLGRPLVLGNYVAYPAYNGLEIGIVTKLNPKMIKVKRMGKSHWEQNKYPHDTIVLDSDEMVFYILKNGA